jgi:transposase InsO family protein
LGEVGVVLVELGLVEQRHKAILEVLGGASVTEVAHRYGVTRQTVHSWLKRYAQAGLAGLVDRPSRPGNCPHQMAPEVVARVVELRRMRPFWGPRSIRHQLLREGVDPLPGRSSIYRYLCRHGLIDPKKRRKRGEDYRRWERSRPMEPWQMDVMGGVMLTDGSELKLVSGLDDHSRFCVSALLAPRATARPVCEALASALRRYGVPDQILTDNGKVFSSRFGPRPGEVLFDRICRENGIRHLLTAPNSPTTTGKVERFHKTIRAEFLRGRVFPSLEEAQADLGAWVAFYNSERPHQGIGMVPPAERFTGENLEKFEPLLPQEDEAPDVELGPHGRRARRKVSANGRMRLAGGDYTVGRFLGGETVEAEFGADGLVSIFHHGVLVATLARKHQKEAEEPALRRRPQGTGGRSKTTPPAVLRQVDSRGDLSFAGTAYHVSMAFASKQAEVRLTGDTVQIWAAGKLIRTHPCRHDKAKEHGAFGVPKGRPRKLKAS